MPLPPPAPCALLGQLPAQVGLSHLLLLSLRHTKSCQQLWSKNTHLLFIVSSLSSTHQSESDHMAALRESLSLLALPCILLDIKLETMTKLKPRVMYTFLCGAKLRFIWCDKGDAALDVTVTLTSCQCDWHSAPKGL